MFKILSDKVSIQWTRSHLVIKICKLKMSFRIKRNNVIVLNKKNGKKVYNPKIKGLKVEFLSSDNLLELYEPLPKFNNVNILLGENCKLKIKNSIHLIRDLIIELPVPNGTMSIGENFFISGGSFFVDYNSTLNIGDDCMFSSKISIMSGDSHIVTDMDGNILSKPSEINIGDHVWVGVNSLILKDSHIPSNSIVGANSVVTKKFLSPNVAIAGNPARVVKENINWRRDNLSRVSPEEV